MRIFYILVVGILWNVSYSVGEEFVRQRLVVPTKPGTASAIALNVFKKHDKSIRRKAFDDFIKFLDEYRKKSILKGGLEIADHLKVLIRSAMNTYFVSTQSFYQWCGLATNCFKSHLKEMRNTTKDAAMKQYTMLFQLLEGEIEKLRSAQKKFQAAQLSFDQVSKKLLIPRLDADYEDYSAKPKEEILRLEKKIKKYRKDCLSLILNNEKICRSKSKIKEIKKNLEKIEKLNNTLKKRIKDVNIIAHNMKMNFEKEFNTMIKVKSQAQMTYDTIYIYTAVNEDDFDVEANSLIKVAVKKLVGECRKYRARHES